MKKIFKKNDVKYFLPATLAMVFLSGCGSGSDTDLTGSGLGSQVDTLIEGRVADGYLQGATVCVDINENDRCDQGEPRSISIAGGAYKLEVPPEHAGKPIFAEVPASAIDEDTGLPIGRDLRLSAPGDRPEFVSPLTTMVHHDKRRNPGRSTEEASEALGEALGLQAGDGEDIFTDYIAGSDTGDETERDKFRELHQNGRALASVMGHIREKAEMQAIESGIDLTGDPEAQKEVAKLVRELARAQVQNLSKNVREKVDKIKIANRGKPDKTKKMNEEFDPEETLEELNIEVPDISTEDSETQTEE